MQNSASDPAALATLDNIEFVRELARRLLTDRHQAEEVAQDTWRVALERWSGEAPARAWLAGVVRRLALGDVRARLRRRELETLAASERAAEYPDPARVLAVGQHLMHAVGRLVPDQRDAIVMRYLEGCSNADIARRLDVSPEVVRKRISRGLAELRLLLDGERDSLGGDWRAALAPVALGAPRLAAVGVALSLKWAAGVLLVVALAFVLQLSTNRSGPAPGPQASELPPVADLAEPEEPAEPVEPIGAGAPSRSVVTAVAPEAPAPSTPVAGLALEVVDAADGAPIEGARLWIDRGAGIESPLELEGGRTRFEPVAGLRLAVAAPGVVAAFVDGGAVAAAEDVLQVALTAGATVSGRVTFAAGAPPDVAPFDLHTSEAEGLDAWPGEFAEALGDWLPFGSVRAVAVEPDGSFAIGGLPARWRGGLWVHSRMRYASVEPEPTLLLPVWLQLDRPETGLAIEMLELPRMVGRVLWAADGSPVTDARVELTMTFVDGSRSTREWVPVDGAGRFEMGIASADDPTARLEVESVKINLFPVGGAVTRLDRDDFDGVGDVDLGDLTVEPVPDVWLRVVDGDGEPIPKALVLPSLKAKGVPEPRHARTDERGRVRFEGLPEDGVTLLVGALGHRTEGLRLRRDRGTEDEPLELELDPAPSIVVAVDGPPESLGRLQLELDCDEPGPFGEPARARGVGERRLAQLRSVLSGGRPELPDLGSFRLNGDGERRLGDLRAGAELGLRLVTRAGDELWSERVVVPDAGERRLDVSIDPPLVTVRGRVVDALGRGVGGVSNGVAVNGRELYHHPLTANDGTFEFVEVVGPQVPLALVLDQLGGMELSLDLPAGRVVHELGDVLLDPGRPVTVEVVDALGRELTADGHWIELSSGATLRTGVLGSGLQISRVPDEDVTLVVVLGGVEYRQRVAAGSAAARFAVPAHGLLRYRVGDGVERSLERVTVEAADGFQQAVTLPASVEWTLNLLPGSYTLTDPSGVRSIEVTAGATATVEAR